MQKSVAVFFSPRLPVVWVSVIPKTICGVALAVLAFPPDRLSTVVNKQSQQLTGLTDPRLLGVTSHLHPVRQFVTDL